MKSRCYANYNPATDTLGRDNPRRQRASPVDVFSPESRNVPAGDSGWYWISRRSLCRLFLDALRLVRLEREAHVDGMDVAFLCAVGFPLVLL